MTPYFLFEKIYRAKITVPPSLSIILNKQDFVSNGEALGPQVSLPEAFKLLSFNVRAEPLGYEMVRMDLIGLVQKLELHTTDSLPKPHKGLKAYFVLIFTCAVAAGL
jgi:hypothetical protein